MSVAIVEENRSRSKIHPKQFALIFACVSIFMMFASFSSAYVVRQAAGNWLEFSLPNIFYYNTVIIVLSSVCLQLSYHFFRKENQTLYRSFLIVSFLLGISFIILQYQGWQALSAAGVSLTSNPSASFVYLISGVHAAHVLGGIGVLTVALVHAFVLKMKLTQRRILRFKLSLTYWHFMGFLWLYIISFFVLQQS